MTSTLGAFSARLDADTFLITPHHVDRSTLALADLVLVRGDAAEPGKTPQLLHAEPPRRLRRPAGCPRHRPRPPRQRHRLQLQRRPPRHPDDPRELHLPARRRPRPLRPPALRRPRARLPRLPPRPDHPPLQRRRPGLRHHHPRRLRPPRSPRIHRRGHHQRPRPQQRHHLQHARLRHRRAQHRLRSVLNGETLRRPARGPRPRPDGRSCFRPMLIGPITESRPGRARRPDHRVPGRPNLDESQVLNCSRCARARK